MSIERFGGLRVAIATEAARLMYEEGVKQYFTAKRMAARRLLGRVAGRRLRYRPADLPSNGEIRDALLALAALAEGSGRTRRLFAMRIVALEAMRAITSELKTWAMLEIRFADMGTILPVVPQCTNTLKHVD